MKRLKSSGFLKLIAWVAFILSLNIFVISTVAMAFMADFGFYHMSYTEVRTSMLEQVNQNFSAQALAWMGQGKEEYFAEKYFEYGIIKAQNWDGDSFKDAEYEELNFDPELLGEENWYIYSDYVSKDTVLVSSEDILGDTNYYLETPYVNETVGHYAERIVYDEHTGVIYYLSEGEYYPAKTVRINFTYQNEPMIYIYEYQFGENNYILRNLWATYSDGDSHSYSTNNIPPDDAVNAENIMSSVLACDEYGGMGASFDFTRLEEVGYSFFNLGDVILDDIRNVDTTEIDVVNSAEMPKFVIHEKDNYYLNEYYTLMVTEHDEAEKYIVVSKIPENFNIDPDHNQYAVVNQRFQMAYEWQYLVFVVMGVAALIVVCSFVFLMKAAGYKRKEEELVLRFFDRIPFEIYAGAIFFAECFGAIGISELTYYMEESVLAWILAAIILLAMEILAILFLLSIAVRVKTKTLWKNTIIYRICHAVAEAVRYFIRNISFVWKAVVGFVVVDGLLMFFVFVLACNSYSEEIFFICLLIDAVIAVIYFMVIVQMNQLQEASKKVAQGNLDYETDTSKMFWEFKKHGDNLNKIGNGISLAVEERMKSEHFKTELITNVSHDIKTPLTSIINYVDLLGKEDLQNENASEYIEVLQRQSSKLKKLIEDLVEASKASTGNLAVNMETLEAGVFLTQTVGEFEEKFAANGLELIIYKPEEPVYICADGRHLWRVVDNLMNNILKYAQPLSRVYVHLEEFGSQVTLTFRNMSKDPLNLTGEELKERFIRGDKSRNSEGHGLGLAIAQSLMDLMKAELTIHVDGDLFKVILTFAKKEIEEA